MRKRLPAGFFDRPPLAVARDLVGKHLVRRQGRDLFAAMITETECYDGERDLACHARHGRTKRNASMWGPPGTTYVYFTYGIHWMLNIVCREEGYPAAVLIRGVEGFSGPARLTKAWGIDGSLNGETLGSSAGLWVEDRGILLPPRAIARTPRIGVGYAGKWADKPWRFVLRRDGPRRARVRRV